MGEQQAGQGVRGSSQGQDHRAEDPTFIGKALEGLGLGLGDHSCPIPVPISNTASAGIGAGGSNGVMT